MIIIDPQDFSRQELDSAHTLPPVGDYLPVESVSGSRWFVVYLPTNQSLPISKLDDDVAREIKEAIAVAILSRDLLNACENERASPVTLSESDLTEARNAFVERYGPLLSTSVFYRVRSAGFSESEVLHALRQFTQEDSLEGVTVVSLSSLLEESHA